MEASLGDWQKVTDVEEGCENRTLLTLDCGDHGSLVK